MSTAMPLTPSNPNFEIHSRAIFNGQTCMHTLGATLAVVEPGHVEIHFPYNNQFAQQNGYLHAGIVTTVVDTACGCAAFTLAPAGANVLTVEYKANFMSPARGERFVATGRVMKAGRTLTICQGEVRAYSGDTETVVAVMLATIMTLSATAR